MGEEKKQINYWGELDYQATYEHLNRQRAEAERPVSAGLEKVLERPTPSNSRSLNFFRDDTVQVSE